MRRLVEERVKILKRMDAVMRTVNDEENGVFDIWLSAGVPDGADDSDYIDIADDDATYIEVCVLWAELMSELIADGEWSSDGYSLELFNINHKS